MTELAVILVHTTSHAIFAERVLLKSGLAAKLVPTPRHLSSDCGMAVRIAAADRGASEAALRAAGVSVDRIEALED